MSTENQAKPEFHPCYETAGRGEIPFLIYFYTSKAEMLAFPYGHLLDVYHAILGLDTEVIMLRFSTSVVTIEGKHLKRILDHLALQQLTEVRMIPEYHQRGASKSEPIVTKITTPEKGNAAEEEKDGATNKRGNGVNTSE